MPFYRSGASDAHHKSVVRAITEKKNSDVEAVKPTAIEDFFFIGSVIDIKEFTRAVMAMAANGLILGNETAWLFRSPTQLAKLALGFNTQI